MKRTRVVNAGLEMCSIEQDFDWIVAQNQKQIYRTLLFLVRDADAAENLTQECFLRAFRMRSKFRGESTPATWLVRIAINLAQDHNRNRRWVFWRRLTRTDRIDAMSPIDCRRSAEQVMIDTQSLRGIWSAVGRLSERQKAVFMLRFIEEMQLEEIAEVMDLKLGSVKSHLHRAIEAVRRSCAPKAG